MEMIHASTFQSTSLKVLAVGANFGVSYRSPPALARITPVTLSETEGSRKVSLFIALAVEIMLSYYTFLSKGLIVYRRTDVCALQVT